MTIVREQFAVAQGSGPAVATFSNTVKSGSLLIAVSSTYMSATFTNTISDDNGNTWTELFDQNYDGNDCVFMAYAVNANPGSTSVTLAGDGSGEYHSLVIIEVSGIVTTSPLDVWNADVSTATSWDSGNVTLSQNDEYAIGLMVHDTGVRTLTPYYTWNEVFKEENQATDMPIVVCDGISTVTGTYSFTGTISGGAITHGAAIATFRGDTSAPATLPRLIHQYRQRRG